jgi:hypothetical protein
MSVGYTGYKGYMTICLANVMSKVYWEYKGYNTFVMSAGYTGYKGYMTICLANGLYGVLRCRRICVMLCRRFIGDIKGIKHSSCQWVIRDIRGWRTCVMSTGDTGIKGYTNICHVNWICRI